ncbi:sugar ABC transporter ATP-binding protein [Methylibium rhizosphaerae]|uniref:sugar ABC transporter ATP-binding protein n=1 Tax=Methylibium rhizosphaerae TaxID=2570323 RepID=UPI00112A2A9C|nr:sugar ABC transporter ATP-binding protein [Methylibium rhizosphaerae]
MSTTRTKPEAAPLLHLRGIGKRFPGVRALHGVELRLFAGEIHALMGQNGAGKSTLIKVLTGVHSADDGEMTLAGHRIAPGSPLEAQRLGISTVYQEVNLCPNLSVAENIYAGRYPRKGAAGGWRIDWTRLNADARALLGRLNLDIDVTRLLSSYSVAVQQMVAIARSLAISARVLILDEPTSSLDEGEVKRLFAVLRQLRGEGLAIVFVTHFLAEVYEISDRITVLRNGELVGEYLTPELDMGALISVMVGREWTAATREQAARTDHAEAPPVLQARGLGRRTQVAPTDLTLQAGEVVGMAGLLGSGRTELARLLFGLDRADSGELLLQGKAVKLQHPAQAVRSRLGLCPEDRKAEGIVAELSVRENIVLALQARMGLLPSLSRRSQAVIAQHFVDALGIKTADLDTPIAQLSGGNQQKALLARWLATEPRLLILDEPTRGVDVAAKQEIMNEVLALARRGVAVLFISAELDEVVRLSDRIVVMRDRRKAGELPGGSSEQAICDVIAGEA